MRQTDSGIGRQRAREAKKDKAAACASGNVTDSGKNSGGGKTQDDSCAREKEKREGLPSCNLCTG